MMRPRSARRLGRRRPTDRHAGCTTRLVPTLFDLRLYRRSPDLAGKDPRVTVEVGATLKRAGAKLGGGRTPKANNALRVARVGILPMRRADVSPVLFAKHHCGHGTRLVRSPASHIRAATSRDTPGKPSFPIQIATGARARSVKRGAWSVGRDKASAFPIS